MLPGLDSAVGPSLEIAGAESQEIQDEVKPPAADNSRRRPEIQQDAPIITFNTQINPTETCTVMSDEKPEKQ